MSTKTLSITHKVDGVLTDATTLKLSDPTGAFGVRLQSDQSVVVADGTDFVNDGMGLYSYEITGLTSGAVYEYWVETVYGGTTKRVEGTFTAGGVSASGLWMTQDYLNTKYGAANQQILADMENQQNTNAITATIQQAIDDSEDEVITNYLSDRYDMDNATLTDADKVTLRRLTGPITEQWLHENRGDREKENPFEKSANKARQDLAALTAPLLPGQNNVAFLSLANRSGWLTIDEEATAITRNLSDNTITQQTLSGANPFSIYP